MTRLGSIILHEWRSFSGFINQITAPDGYVLGSIIFTYALRASAFLLISPDCSSGWLCDSCSVVLSWSHLSTFLHSSRTWRPKKKTSWWYIVKPYKLSQKSYIANRLRVMLVVLNSNRVLSWRRKRLCSHSIICYSFRKIFWCLYSLFSIFKPIFNRINELFRVETSLSIRTWKSSAVY